VAVYVSIRGWLECDEEQVAAIQDIVSTGDGGLYSGGWSFPREPFNWIRYVFFGGDVRQEAIPGFLGHLVEIARIPASDSDNDLVLGLFLASHEVDGMEEWQIRDGQVLVSPADARYQYLDA
jgi:hypothetical protein